MNGCFKYASFKTHLINVMNEVFQKEMEMIYQQLMSRKRDISRRTVLVCVNGVLFESAVLFVWLSNKSKKVNCGLENGL